MALEPPNRRSTRRLVNGCLESVYGHLRCVRRREKFRADRQSCLVLSVCVEVLVLIITHRVRNRGWISDLESAKLDHKDSRIHRSGFPQHRYISRAIIRLTPNECFRGVLPDPASLTPTPTPAILIYASTRKNRATPPYHGATRHLPNSPTCRLSARSQEWILLFIGHNGS